MKALTYPFLKPLSLTFKVALLLVASVLFSCKKTDLSPITGIYIGETTAISWGFEELLDNEGNFAGVVETRDTVFDSQDAFIIKEGSENPLFTVSGDGSLARVNTFSNHEFTYEGQQAFSVVDVSNGVENKRLEFSVDGAGNISLFYTDNQFNANRPPVGHEITFSGARQ